MRKEMQTNGISVRKNRPQSVNIWIFIVAIYNYMIADGYTTNQDLIILLSQRLKEYRLAARISQREMAERSGVCLTTISHL